MHWQHFSSGHISIRSYLSLFSTTRSTLPLSPSPSLSLRFSLAKPAFLYLPFSPWWHVPGAPIYGHRYEYYKLWLGYWFLCLVVCCCCCCMLLLLLRVLTVDSWVTRSLCGCLWAVAVAAAAAVDQRVGRVPAITASMCVMRYKCIFSCNCACIRAVAACVITVNTKPNQATSTSFPPALIEIQKS